VRRQNVFRLGNKLHLKAVEGVAAVLLAKSLHNCWSMKSWRVEAIELVANAVAFAVVSERLIEVDEVPRHVQRVNDLPPAMYRWYLTYSPRV
jgi:hypothetical protein